MAVDKKGVSKKKGSVKAAVGKMNVQKLIFAAISAFVIIYFGVTVISQQISISKQNRRIEELQDKISEAQQESESLKNQVDNLNNPEYIEKVAREQLGLIRPNERVFVDSNKSENNK